MPSFRLARLGVAVTLVVAVPLVGVLPATAAARSGYERTVAITFPVRGPSTYADTYHAPRGSTRFHQATDIMAGKHQKVHAAKAGTVCFITGINEPEPSYGYMVRICGSDGLQYSYVHLNNDTPGTDDGKGGPKYAYAKGIDRGVTVRRGQHIGYIGDSGNAEATAPHLHFEISDPALEDPRIDKQHYDPLRINPFFSLRRAEARGDLPGVKFPKPQEPDPVDEAPDPPTAGDAFADIATSPHRDAVNRLARAGITGGCTDDRFCPDGTVTRAQTASLVTRAAAVPYVTAVAFDDIDDTPHAPAINALAAAGIVQGCAQRAFCPGEAVTRAQMATFLARTYRLTPKHQPAFRDVDPYHSHAAAIAAIAEAGITTGCTAKRFCPNRTVTRAQMAAFLDRARVASL